MLSKLPQRSAPNLALDRPQGDTLKFGLNKPKPFNLAQCLFRIEWGKWLEFAKSSACYVEIASNFSRHLAMNHHSNSITRLLQISVAIPPLKDSPPAHNSLTPPSDG